MSEKGELEKFLVTTGEYLNNYQKLLPEEGAARLDWYARFEKLSSSLDPEIKENLIHTYDVLSESESLYLESIENMIWECENLKKLLTNCKEDKE